MRKTYYWPMPGAAGAAALFLALLVWPGPAPANQCQYSDNNDDDGPCLVVNNGLNAAQFGNTEMHLWCLNNGPSAADHRIVLKPGDSYTCRGIPDDPNDPDDDWGTEYRIKRHQANCNDCSDLIACSGRQVVTLRKQEGGEYLKWESCVTN